MIYSLSETTITKCPPAQTSLRMHFDSLNVYHLKQEQQICNQNVKGHIPSAQEAFAGTIMNIMCVGRGMLASW